eukprot:SAG11_NODE_31399_length_292_cov_0.797927_1_plen_28_part_10
MPPAPYHVTNKHEPTAAVPESPLPSRAM